MVIKVKNCFNKYRTETKKIVYILFCLFIHSFILNLETVDNIKDNFVRGLGSSDQQTLAEVLMTFLKSLSLF